MTPTDQLQIALAIIAVIGGMITTLLVLGLRALWVLAQRLQEDRDATRANTVAITNLSNRVDALDGRRRRRW